jgi:Pyruvate/2-oxoacid:ferredoxin oxidoreductase gamma subunit
MVKNIVVLGALAAATGLFPAETLRAAIREALHLKPDLVQLNLDAFESGLRSVVR